MSDRSIYTPPKVGFLLIGMFVLGVLGFNVHMGAVNFSNSAIVAAYFTGHLSFHSAEVALTAMGIPTGVAIKILTSSSVWQAFEEDSLTVTLEHLLEDALGFWGLVLLGVSITAIA